MNETIDKIKVGLETILKDYMFECNDKKTWDSASGKVFDFLGSLIDTEEIYDYSVRCDGTNNTPETIDAAELHLDAAVKLDKDSEFIFMPVTLKPTKE